MFEPGDKIDDVEILARLKAGGMAALYLGRRQGAGGFSRDLAIKVIHAHLSGDQSFVEMFVDEARLSARIDHPNVVRVEALKEWKGNYCLLMEFIQGCSLSQLMATLKKNDQRFSPELAVAIAIRVADGLHAAHELLNPDGSQAGVVHRDVSPANVLCGYRGEVKLIDFGIAKATQRLHQTEAAGLKGKIAYMSPEQAFGRDVDRRTDVYALAIVLWEMLTMRRLFKADNDLRLLDMVRDPKVVPPSALVPDVPKSLDKAIVDALARDREGRPGSCRDFRYRLLDALPMAAAIDPLQLSAVMCDVMAEKIEEDRDILSLSSFRSLPNQSMDRDSVTLSRLLRPVHNGAEISLEDLHASADSLARQMSGFQAPARDAPPALLPTADPLTPLSVATGMPQRRRLLPMVIGAAAVIGLAAGGAVGLGYAFTDRTPAIQTTTLPSTGAPDPAETLPPAPLPAGGAPSVPSPEIAPAVAGAGVPTAVPPPAAPEQPTAPAVAATAEIAAAAPVAAEPEDASDDRRRAARRRSATRAAAPVPMPVPQPVAAPAPAETPRPRRAAPAAIITGEEF